MTAIDLRGASVPQVRDQGRRPTCTPLAVTALHEFTRILKGEPLVNLAPEPIWMHGLAHGTADDSGMWPHDSIDVVAIDGQPTLELWPYNRSLFAGTEAEPVPSVGSRRFTSHHQKVTGGPNELHDFLENGFPVLVIIKMSSELYNCDQSIVPEPTAFLTGTHAVLCVGALNHPDRGRLFLIRNSWGTNWGLEGYAYISEAYLTRDMLVAA
jgi:hypothetical protein